MALIVFMRGVNVGGHKSFQPSVLAKELAEFDVVNIGAAGTFVVRKKISPTALRDEFLNREEFESESQARALGALWKEEYNTERPHSSLRYQTPAEFSATCPRYVPTEEEKSDPPTTEPPNR